jgi:hypothetical protein
MSVLHIYDPDYRLGVFELLNMLRVTRGADVSVHVDRGDTNVDMIFIGRDGAIRDITCASGVGGCGCP